jgi:hypothetical protein
MTHGWMKVKVAAGDLIDVRLCKGVRRLIQTSTGADRDMKRGTTTSTPTSSRYVNIMMHYSGESILGSNLCAHASGLRFIENILFLML